MMDRTRFGIISACSIGNAVSLTPAVHATFGLFLIPLATAFGWPRAAISGVLGLVAITSALVLPLAGLYADRHGARRMVIAGNLILAGGIALLALTNGSLPRFYLTFVPIAVGGAMSGTAILSKVVSDWFDARRGTMLGISAGGGNGLGSTVMPIFAALTMAAYGWRGAYLGIGALVALLGVTTLVLLLRDAPRYGHRDATDMPPADGMTLGEAVRTRSFWLLIVAMALGAGCLTAVFSHVVPILAERGIGVAAATAVVGVFALVTAGWQIAIGAALDRVSSARVAAPMVLIAVGGVALLATAATSAALLAGAVLLGIGLGTQYGSLSYFIARYFGLRSFGSIIGIMYSAVFLAQGTTPILLDHGFDVQGTYRSAMIAIGACLALTAALLLLLPPYRRPAGTIAPAAVHA